MPLTSAAAAPEASSVQQGHNGPRGKVQGGKPSSQEVRAECDTSHLPCCCPSRLPFADVRTGQHSLFAKSAPFERFRDQARSLTAGDGDPREMRQRCHGYRQNGGELDPVLGGESECHCRWLVQ
jgi:hypothetical protein